MIVRVHYTPKGDRLRKLVQDFNVPYDRKRFIEKYGSIEAVKDWSNPNLIQIHQKSHSPKAFNAIFMFMDYLLEDIKYGKHV